MCDTMVILANSTEDGSVIFGKNSDRDPGEAHAIHYIPRTVLQEGKLISCQYLDIPIEKELEINALIVSKNF